MARRTFGAASNSLGIQEAGRCVRTHDGVRGAHRVAQRRPAGGLSGRARQSSRATHSRPSTAPRRQPVALVAPKWPFLGRARWLEGCDGSSHTPQFIAVGTPPDEDGSAGLQYVLAAARNIARLMTDYKVVIDKSIVPVGTGAAPSSPNTPPTPCVAAHPPGPAEAARSARLPHARAGGLSKDSGLMQQAKTISARPTVCYFALCL